MTATVLESAAARLATIGLDELGAAALQTRQDRKYVVSREQAARLVGALAPTHRVLAIEGRISSTYDSVYYDSSSLGAFRAHVQGRRRRYKVRTRTYVESGTQMLEIKMKGQRGETIKLRTDAGGRADHQAITPAGRAFVERTIADAYPALTVPELRPVLRTRYRRITLVAGAARVTLDIDLRYAQDGEPLAMLAPEWVIVESKSEGRSARADELLRALGARPVDCSKYCVGVTLLRPQERAHDLLRIVRRHFIALPREQAVAGV